MASMFSLIFSLPEQGKHASDDNPDFDSGITGFIKIIYDLTIGKVIKFQVDKGLLTGFGILNFIFNKENYLISQEKRTEDKMIEVIFLIVNIEEVKCLKDFISDLLVCC